MAKPLLPYGRQSIDDDDIAAVVEQLRGDWLTQGPAVHRFEEGLAQAVGSRHVVAVSSGTAALHLACLAAGVRAGDSGVTADVTFVASANAIRYADGAPALADVDPSTGLATPDAVQSCVDRLTAEGRAPKVIIPVDLTGTPADLPRLRQVAERVGAVVIEDAAHSLGATYEYAGKTFRAGDGAHAHMAALSFHPVKHITTGEGGAICTNDDALYRELLDLRSHGITRDPARMTRNDGPWYYEQHALGFNYRITDVQCALGTSQLARLNRFLARRRAIAKRYDAAFAQVLPGDVAPLTARAGTVSAYHLYVLRLLGSAGEPLESVARRRRALFESLREDGIAPQVHYIPVHRQPDYVRAGLARGEYPGAESYYAGCISLPLFPAMKDEDVDRVVDSVVRSLSKRR